MPSKNVKTSEPVVRLRKLLKELKAAQGTALDLTEQARREVGDAIGHADLMPVATPAAEPIRRVRRKQKKR